MAEKQILSLKPAPRLEQVGDEHYEHVQHPCNVIVEEHDGGVEVSAVDPVASMQAIDNPSLAELAKEVQTRLKRVVEEL
jgi:hypothetical protein